MEDFAEITYSVVLKLPSLKRDKKWEFVPAAKVGDEVGAGDVIGTVQETSSC